MTTWYLENAWKHFLIKGRIYINFVCQGANSCKNSIEFKRFMERVNQLLCFFLFIFMEVSSSVLLIVFLSVGLILCLIYWISSSSIVTDNREGKYFELKFGNTCSYKITLNSFLLGFKMPIFIERNEALVLLATYTVRQNVMIEELFDI